MLFALLALEGGFINGVQTTLYALGSAIYPTSLRAFGVGAATGIGRAGAIASSLLGALVIGWGAAAGFHWSIALVMCVVAIALLGIRITPVQRSQPTLIECSAAEISDPLRFMVQRH
jgi:AAHS family 4-hydroxybenzoate transporter-like MFS transporter